MILSITKRRFLLGRKTVTLDLRDVTPLMRRHLGGVVRELVRESCAPEQKRASESAYDWTMTTAKSRLHGSAARGSAGARLAERVLLYSEYPLGAVR